MGAVTAYHLRCLCENPWNGGCGYRPDEVGRMTQDQVWFRLCDMDILKRSVGNRVKSMESLEVLSTIKSDQDGMILGRARDGSQIRGKIRGKSRARELMEQKQQKEAHACGKVKRRKKR